MTNFVILPSLEHITLVKLAALICDHVDIKKEIFCSSESEYGNYTKDYFKKFSRRVNAEAETAVIEKWDEIVQKKVKSTIEKLDLPTQMSQRIRNLVKPIGLRMLSWAKYHETEFHLTRNFTISFLNSSSLTTKGTVDKRKAAYQLVIDENIDVCQRYRIACIYFVVEHIEFLWHQIPEERKREFYHVEGPENVAQPPLIKLWTYHLMDKTTELISSGNSFWRYGLEKAIESGNEVAAKHCWRELGTRRNELTLVETALKAPIDKIQDWEWALISDIKETSTSNSFFPFEYYTDLLCFLLAQMSEVEQAKFLRKDIEKRRYSCVLECFLEWPYQDYFMEAAKLLWGVLSVENYGNLLLKITDKIVNKSYERKDYNYRLLLQEFWCQSNDYYKRYILSDNGEIVDWFDDEVWLKVGKALLLKLCKYENFTSEDEENIFLILKYATPEEKENIIFSYEGKSICVEFIQKKRKWCLLDSFIKETLSSDEKISAFKKDFAFSRGTLLCAHFVQNEEWELVEQFIEWTSLCKEDVVLLKEKTIFSADGKRTCRYLILDANEMEAADKFVKWCLSSDKKIGKFKKELIHFEESLQSFRNLILDNRLECVDKFIRWCLSSEQDICNFKKGLANGEGNEICTALICKSYLRQVCNDKQNATEWEMVFDGGKWEQVEMFLTWCFSSEEEIDAFKKRLRRMDGAAIHFDLLCANKWAETETFFDWCGLSEEEVKEFKKATLTSELGALKIKSWIYGPDYDCTVGCSNNWETMNFILRWCLIDRDSIFRFLSVLHSGNDCDTVGKSLPWKKKKYLVQIMLQLFEEYAEEQRGTKRTREAAEESLPNNIKFQHKD